MRLIDADKMKESITKQMDFIMSFNNNELTEIACLIERGTIQEIDNAPTIDAVEVVRCKDCCYCEEREGYAQNVVYVCLNALEAVNQDDYCSYGERRD